MVLRLTQRYCPRCGETLRRHNAFCSVCGEVVDKAPRVRLLTQRSRGWVKPALYFAVIAVAMIAIITFMGREARRPDRSAPVVFHEHVTSGAMQGANLLFVTLDTVRADHIGCYGFAKARTPTIDRWADHGVRFDHAVTGVPITLPSHCTMMTGLEVPNHGVRVNGKFVLSDEFTTLAEVLRTGGYATAAFVASYVLDARYGLNQGFDHYDDNVNPVGKEMGARSSLRRADHVTDAAVAWINRHLQERPDQPFFVWTHYFDPHQPHQPPPEFAERFPNSPYDGEIAFVDHELRRFTDLLEARNLTEDTLIVLTADHGEGLGEHHEQGHSRLIYDTTMRIPLIFSNPSLFAGAFRVDDITVGTIDIMPTVLSLLGVEAGGPGSPNLGDSMDGIDLATAPVGPDRAMYLETLAPLLNHGWSSLHGLRTVEGKYILAPTREYYNLRDDPGERDNLYPAGAADFSPRGLKSAPQQLADLLASWPPVEGVSATASALSPEEAQRLASLGYIDTASADSSSDALPDPKDMMPIFEDWLQAQALSEHGYHERALALLQETLRQAPDQPFGLELLSTVYQRLNDFKKAEEALRKMVAIKPNAKACVRLAQFLILRKEFAEAEKALQEAAECDPRDGAIFIARGDGFAFQGRYEEAIAQFELAIAIDPYRSSAVAREKITQARQYLKRSSG